MSNCTDHFPTTDVLYKELDGETGTQVITAICCFLVVCTCAIFLEKVWFIVHHYPHKAIRSKHIILIGLLPTIGLTSCLAVLVPRTTLICELIASTFLSVCLLLFVNLIVSYFRGNKGILESMSGEKLQFGTPPCCCCCFCLNSFPFNKKYLRIATFMVIQIVVLRPLELFITIILWADGIYTPGDESSFRNAVFYTNLLSGISTLVGIWGLSIMFRATNQRLQQFRIRLKFASLQIMFILVNLQFAIISILARNDIPECMGTRDSLVRGYRIHHMLLMFESFLVSILSRFAYRQKDPELISNTETEIKM